MVDVLTLRRSLAVCLLAIAIPALHAQYAGPSILSRGGNQPGRRGRVPVNFTLYLSAGARYETGLLIPSRVDANGQQHPVDDYGASGEWGLYGGHDWRRTSLGIDYRGDYRNYQKRTTGIGTNHAFSGEYSIRASRHLRVVLRETAGTTNRAFGSFAAPAFADTSRLGVPLNELFDVRTWFNQTSANVLWQKTARVSYGGGIEGFFVKRDSQALVNSQGYSAQANARYRLSRADSIELNYQYMHFAYPRAFSDTNSHGAGVRYERTIGRSTTISALGGLFYGTSSGTQTVALSPEVAAILGHPSTTAAFVRSFKAPWIDLGWRYTQARGSFYANAQTGLGAGNGVYLTTKRSTANAGYSFTGLRKWALGFSGGYTLIQSASLELQDASYNQVGGGFSRKFAENFSVVGQLDYRNFRSGSTPGRDGMAAFLGISWSTSHLPLSIW